MSKRWTIEEIKFLENNYPENGANYCAQLLNKSHKAVALKAMRLGLKVIKPCSSMARTNEQYNKEIHPLKAEEKYINNRTHIYHSCPKGHKWKTSPEVLLRGSGCPSCANYGFDLSAPSILYFVSLEDNGNIVYKLGVTNKDSVIKRYPGEWTKLNMKSIWEIRFDTGKQAKEIEKHLLNQAEKHVSKVLKAGNTELVRHYIDKPIL